ncbi:hypothetical protein NEOLEDRAFT_1101858 [Neolentinus lepideus HHB14362 ss-1]|uniref:BTB domain-containing protein n=1 Tax=Neolentinus lepideus HHB14362 ss-1 TaxID=1314782 RepID=A0A165NIP3_9AGAM|nr:hypothetical protein NEOLEDRAFT_1101858 [Neolentinus lepideus HHB14362 ss-1]
MEKVSESSLRVTQTIFKMVIDDQKLGCGETTFWSDLCGEGWRCGISTSYDDYDSECVIRLALDLSSVDSALVSLTFSGSLTWSSDYYRDDHDSNAICDYIIKLPNDEPMIPHSPTTISLGEGPVDLTVTFKIAYSYRPKRMPSELQETLKSTISSGSFTNAKFLLYSRRGQSGRVDSPLPLFANSTVLKNHCPSYFEPLFSDRFTELSVTDVEAYDYYSDSDYSDCSEGDDVDSGAEPQPEQAATPENCSISGDTSIRADESKNDHVAAMLERKGENQIRTIVVTDFAFRTYRALIYYLYTGSISFAPLKSTRSRASGKEAEDNKSQVDDLRCSPKSMYRLADKLGLDDLKQQALSFIRSGISETNVVQEVGSRFTGIPEYNEIRQTEIQVLSDKWAVPGVKEAFLELLKRAMLGELPHATDTLLAFVSRMKPAF